MDLSARIILQTGGYSTPCHRCKCPGNCKRSTTCSRQAEHYANYSMRNFGRVPPALFLLGADGPVIFIPENLADDDAKDDFATTVLKSKASVRPNSEPACDSHSPGTKTGDTDQLLPRTTYCLRPDGRWRPDLAAGGREAFKARVKECGPSPKEGYNPAAGRS